MGGFLFCGVLQHVSNGDLTPLPGLIASTSRERTDIMAKNINNKSFDSATKLKLSIFGECFKEWLPVFLYNPFIDAIHIYDFFAGSGYDKDGEFGSPLVLLDEARGDTQKYCANVDKKTTFNFFESQKRKSQDLRQNVAEFRAQCEEKHGCDKCVYSAEVKKAEFQNAFLEREIQEIFLNKKIGKFVLLDQYGFKHIDEDVFSKLIEYPSTDFIFFISSGFIKRFKDHPNTKAYIDTEKINFDETDAKGCHRVIANYFKTLIPEEKDYFLHHFTIKKDSSSGYYGLIFGTNHSLGMEKFLKVCWQKDELSGESNCNIDNDYMPDSLFYVPGDSNKRREVEKRIEVEILSGELKTNKAGLKFALLAGCEPKIFTDIVKRLEKEGKVVRGGHKNYSSTSIHRVKEYSIEVV
jgi:three-Cys-motif partner protein